MSQENQLFIQAASEIRQLRSQNQLMAARLGVFDSMMSVLNAQVRSDQMGMSEDVVWKIERHLQDQEQKAENLHL